MTIPHTLTFLAPLPGIGVMNEVTVEPLDDAGLLFAARDQSDRRLFLLDPAPYFQDYTPTLTGETLSELGTDTPDIYVIVTPGGEHSGPSANLLALIAVNPVSHAALQVILADEWPVRAPLTAA